MIARRGRVEIEVKQPNTTDQIGSCRIAGIAVASKLLWAS
jgi:hypothetical protein